MKEYVLDGLSKLNNGYSVCGIVDRKKRIYPLGSDTKVLSSIFEVIAGSILFQYAEDNQLQLQEPTQQNYYPDFTLIKAGDEKNKIAIDVKTTYRRGEKFGYTLGSYTSYITTEKPTKNILYPYYEYQ